MFSHCFTHTEFRAAYDAKAGRRKAPSLWRVASYMAHAALGVDESVSPVVRDMARLLDEHEGDQVEKVLLAGFFKRHRVEAEDIDLNVAEEWQCVTLAAEIVQLAADMAALDEGRILQMAEAGESYATSLSKLAKSAVKFLDIEFPVGIERPVALREGASLHEALLAPGSLGVRAVVDARRGLEDEEDEGRLGIAWNGYDHGTFAADVVRDIERYCTATYSCSLAELEASPLAQEALTRVEACSDALAALGWTSAIVCELPGACTLRAHKLAGTHVASRSVKVELCGPEAVATRVAKLFSADIPSELPMFPALEADWSMMTMMELQLVVDELNVAAAVMGAL